MTGSAEADHFASIEFRKVDTAEALRLAAEMRSHAAATPFQMAGWLEAIVSTLPNEDSERPFFVAGFDGSLCVVLLPLVTFEMRSLRALGWLGQSVSDYNGPVIDRQFLGRVSPAIARRIWGEAAKLAGPVDLVYARKQPVEIGGLDNPFSTINARTESDRAHMRRLTRPWPEIEAELIGKKSKKRLKEKQRALAKKGEFEVRAAVGPDEIDRCCQHLMTWKCDQLERTGATNPFSDPSYRSFMAAACRGGNLVLHAVFLDGVPVAVTCLLMDTETWTLYQTGFDPAYSRHSVGRILNFALLDAAFRSDVRVFDFGYGDEEYKQPLCDQSVPLTFSLMPLTVRGRLLALLIGNALALRKRIKGNTRLREGALWLKRNARHLPGRGK